MVYREGSSSKKSKRAKKPSSVADAALVGQLLQQMKAAESGMPIPPVTADLSSRLPGTKVIPDLEHTTSPLPMGNNTNYNQPGSSSVADAPDPIEQAMAQLYKGYTNLASDTPSGYSSSDIQALMSNAGAAGSPYDAQIQTIKDFNTGARSDTKKGQKKIKAMYRALAEDDASQSQQAVNTQKSLADQINQMAATGNSQNQAHAQELMASNAKYGGDIAAQLNTDIAKSASTAQASNTQQAANFAASALARGGNNANYFQANRSADKLEGTNRSADLISSLQSYLQGNRDKIAELVGQKGAAIQNARNSILSQITNAGLKAQTSGLAAKEKSLSGLASLLQDKMNYTNQQADNNRADAQLQAQLAGAQSKGSLSSRDLMNLLQRNGAFKTLDKNGKQVSMPINDIIKELQALAQGQ